jgi:hypothetical protein
VGVVAGIATQNYRSGEAWMAVFAVGAFAALDGPEPSLFQVGNQLANFSRHEDGPGERKCESSVEGNC